MGRKAILEITCFITFALWLGLNLYGIVFRSFLISTKLIHLLGGFAVAFILSRFLKIYLSKRKIKLTLLEEEALIFLVVNTLGVFDELIDLFFEFLTTRPVLGGRRDTALDLLMNTIGIILFLFLKRLFEAKDRI